VEAIPDLDDSNPVDRSGNESQQEAIPQQQAPPATPHPADRTGTVDSEDNTQQPERDTTPTHTYPADRPGSVEEDSVEEDNPINQPQPDYTVTTAPFTTADLIAEQKKDPALQPMFDAAVGPLPTEFVIKNDILYAVNLEPKQQEEPYKIVVPKTLQEKVLNIGHACSGHFGDKKTKKHIQINLRYNSYSLLESSDYPPHLGQAQLWLFQRRLEM